MMAMPNCGRMSAMRTKDGCGIKEVAHCEANISRKIDLVVALAMSCQYLVKLDGQTIYLSGDI